ncbi:DUF4214 domain-containing protein [Massilia sp. TS11]|uniref:DUF4214 domain-containing protein n=1 Tax=Massilia sp. TS11 TaxID=2908003 RepID=UPI001EDA304C|nr:DUF4214 domain-containing protein [Massilia sp. TS11]MCG2583763.1 DUF4214 domain-containing protein [Massilia sp. TS11]
MAIATYTGTSGNDSWTVVQGGSFILDGGDGVDTLSLGTSLRSQYTIKLNADGTISLDTVSGASQALHATLKNMEILTFNSGRDVLDLRTYFGDTTPPTLSGSTPASGGLNVALGANLTLSFSEAIVLGSGSIVLKNAAGQTIESYTIGSSANLSVSGSTLTVNPSADLQPGTSYTLSWSSGAVKDAAGNALASGSSISFSTIPADHAPTGSVSIAGQAYVGQTLTASNTLADVDGLGAISYQWLSDGQAISGATGATLVLGAAQANHAISVVASYTDALGYKDSMSSSATALVVAALVPDAANSTLQGTSGNDVMLGDARNNSFAGSAGKDSIDGGAGVDTLILPNPRASYTVSQSAAGLSISDAAGNLTTATNIERIKFADVSVAYDISGNGGEVYRLYQAAFNRTPDAGGLGYWMSALDKGAALVDIAAGFVSSAEFQSMYGVNATNTSIVTTMYTNVLHRAPDAGGLAFWVNVLDSHNGTVPQVLAAFSESPENQSAVALVIGNGFPYTPFA